MEFDTATLTALAVTYGFGLLSAIATLVVGLYLVAFAVKVVGQIMEKSETDPSLRSFIESLVATNPYYAVRLLGGILFLSGMFFFAWNTWKTLTSKEMKPVPASEPAVWGDHA